MGNSTPHQLTTTKPGTVESHVGNSGSNTNFCAPVVHSLLYWKLLVSIETLAQRFTFNVWHHIIQKTLGVAGIVQRQDVRMVKPGCELYLSQKTIGAKGGREIGMQNLERNYPFMLDVLSEINRSHSATPQLAVYRVRG